MITTLRNLAFDSRWRRQIRRDWRRVRSPTPRLPWWLRSVGRYVAGVAVLFGPIVLTVGVVWMVLR